MLFSCGQLRHDDVTVSRHGARHDDGFSSIEILDS